MILTSCRRLALLAALVAVALPSAAQSVSGVVTDSTDIGLPDATVVLLQRADSSIISFGTSRDDGAFEIRRVPRGEFLLQITFVGFLPSTTLIEVADGPVDVGRVQLVADVDGLDPLVVTADRVAMVIKRDTLEFNGNAFYTPEGSSVEDLLRRLPGVEVNRDGSIQAQGEDVERVLVDGKEFFGNDPTIATRNLPADAVDRVQIYDRASETAEFTGVDDGQEERTINLALRPDRRVGQFGSLRGGLGGTTTTPGADASGSARFDGSASVNRFSPSTQLSFIGNANNVNRQDFGVEDMIQFMGGLSGLASGGSIRLNTEAWASPSDRKPRAGLRPRSRAGSTSTATSERRRGWRATTSGRPSGRSATAMCGGSNCSAATWRPRPGRASTRPRRPARIASTCR